MVDKTCVETNGNILRIKSDNVTVLETPFVTLPLTPPTVMVRNPATGLPAYATGLVVPTPKAVSSTFGSSDPVGSGGTTDPVVPVVPLNPERACGAAVAMERLLHQIYQATIWLINKEKANIIAGFFSELANLLRAQLVALLTEAELAQFEIDAAEVAADIVVALAAQVIHSSTSLPDLSAGQNTVVTCTAWTALWLRGGDYLTEAASPSGNGTRGNWLTNLDAASSYFDGAGTTNWQLLLLKTLIGATPDNSWFKAADVGSLQPSIACRVCGGYP